MKHKGGGIKVNLHTSIQNLSKRKPIIRSENELLESLYHEIGQEGFNCFKNSTLLGEKVDLLIEDINEGVYYAIHLRNKTAKLTYQDSVLKNHGAQLQGRYDFLKDIECLEKITHSGSVIGYNILLTNDHSYWNKPNKINALDAAFHIYDERIVTGELKWGDETALGTKINRTDSIHLKNTYKCTWNQYSYVSNRKNGTFEYLLMEVK